MGEQQLNNFNSYNAEMKKSLLDKIYFMDKVESKVFVDFGCANGELIKFLNALFPEYHYIGYDIDENMIKLAYENLTDENGVISDNITLMSKWEEVESYVLLLNEPTTLILNSVIHEVYSYSNLIENNNFWKNVFGGIFDYVVVRDMLPKHSIDKKSDINDVAKIRKKANRCH